MGKSKFSLALLPLILVLLLCLSLPALAKGDITIYVNEQILEPSQEPIIENGRVLAPLRAIVESFGLAIDYDDASKTITATDKNHTIILKVGATEALVNGQSVSLDAAAKIVNGSTMVPLRFIGESLGLMVEWNPEARTVMVSEFDFVLNRGAWNSNLEMVKMALAKGANPNSGKISIPIIHSCEEFTLPDQNNLEILKLLLQHGADPNAVHLNIPNLGGYPTSFAATPEPSIFLFLSQSNVEYIKLFVEYGLDLNIKNSKNQTPLSYMRERAKGDARSTEIIALLSNATQQKSSYLPREGDLKRPDKQVANAKYIYEITDEHLDSLQQRYEDLKDNFKPIFTGGQYYEVRPFGYNLIYPKNAPEDTQVCLNIINPLDFAYVEAAARGLALMDFRSGEARAIYDLYEQNWLIHLVLVLPTSKSQPKISISQQNSAISYFDIEKYADNNDGYDNYSIIFSQQDIDVSENLLINASCNGESYNFSFIPYFYRYY